MFQIQPLLHDCNRDVGRDGNPYLRLDGVLCVAVKRLDAKVLFDPFKKQLHLPSLLVKSANRDGGQCKVVGQKLERLASLDIDERYTPEWLWVAQLGQNAGQSNVMIADQPNVVSNGKRLNQVCLHVAFRTRHKEGSRRMQFVESREVDVGFVHDIKRASLDVALLAEQVEHFDVVHFAVADMNKTRNRALQIYQRMKLDCRFGRSKRSPVEQAQTQIYRRRVECVHRSAHQRLQFRVRRFVGVKYARRFDQMMSQVCKNFPRPDTTCVGQRVARHRNFSS